MSLQWSIAKIKMRQDRKSQTLIEITQREKQEDQQHIIKNTVVKFYMTALKMKDFQTL